MDLSKLSTGDKVVVGSGLAYVLFMFFPWFTVDLGPFGDYSENGWDYFFTGIIPMLLALAMLAWIVVTKLAETDLPEIPIPEGLLMLILGGAAALLVVLRVLIGGDDDGTDVLDRSFGLILAMLAAIGLAVGAFLKFQESGGELPGKPSSGDSGTPTPF